ncbi:MAG: aspartyl protease family protein [Chloroflexi bacterium]|nr:aspartyl protease family protein [Chloroflexota bacterium]
MGTSSVTIEVGDPQGQRYETVEALVDTGATYSQMPSSFLERLGVRPHGLVTFLYANGAQEERPIGRTWVRLGGKAEITLVVFGAEDAGVLLGAYTMEGFLVAPDPLNRRLVPVLGLMM